MAIIILQVNDALLLKEGCHSFLECWLLRVPEIYIYFKNEQIKLLTGSLVEITYLII